MGLITEAHQLFAEMELVHGTYAFGYIFIQPRRVGRGRSKVLEKFLEENMSDKWDAKIKQESIYASSEIERFKADKLPLILKKLNHE